MLPVNPGGYSAYQNFVLKMLRKYYPNPQHGISLTVSGILIFPILTPL